jgi:uncharacterized protein
MPTVAAVRWSGPRASGLPALPVVFHPADFQPRLRTRLLVLQPTPFCNIRCNYCYLPDRDNRSRMSLAVVQQAVQRLVDDDLLGDRLTVLWHAGEPLAVPTGFYDEAFEVVRRIAGPGCIVTQALQTNAMLIDDAWCALFKRHAVQVGVSIDGPAFLHDHHRVTRRGHGTHARTMRGIARLRAQGIGCHAIAVVTADTLAHADAFADFFETLGVSEVGCNVDEAEGAHAVSSVQGQEAAHQAFLARLFARAQASEGRLNVREQTQTWRRLDPSLPRVRWQGVESPDNAQVLPFAIVNVAWQGDFSSFSPELLGLPSADFDGFTLGNVLQGGYLASAQTDRFERLWSAIRQGTEACRQTCRYFDYCGGGAPVNKLFENGSLASAETLYCRSMVQRPIDTVLAQARATAAADHPLAQGA